LDEALNSDLISERKKTQQERRMIGNVTVVTPASDHGQYDCRLFYGRMPNLLFSKMPPEKLKTSKAIEIWHKQSMPIVYFAKENF